jgi:hypothetical protein
MTTVLIIVCVLFCIGIVAAIAGHLGYAITRDKAWRIHVRHHHRMNAAKTSKLTRPGD